MSATAPLRVVLISTYELGHQPFGLASPAAWLGEMETEVACLDLAVQPLDEEAVAKADLIGVYVSMHTATRLASQLLPRLRAINADAHVCVYGLYAPVNEAFLRELGADTIVGGEFEEPLVALARRLAGGWRPRRGGSQELPVVSLARQQFKVPDRSGLPGLGAYAHLQLPDGQHRIAGYTEATRGCKHLCRHCPIVPVYGGRFRVVQREVVLEDIAQQVDAGARHITFGDPDFFNGPAHALGVVHALHERFPELTYDVTIKIEHLVKHARHLSALRRTGCLLVTSAVESFQERELQLFDKCHSREDFLTAVHLLRASGIAFNPTFVAFTPWTTLQTYVDFLVTISKLGLVGNVAPIQYAIRLLIPEGSRLLELVEIRQFLDGFEPGALCYRWVHPDPRVDELQQRVFGQVQRDISAGLTRDEVFRRVCAATAASAEAAQRVWLSELDHGPPPDQVPYLTEPWYC
jgi:radical SAM superfamily enzyme YgiQ (UPF0313 family)